jgi:hypothetical protein
MKTQHDPKLIKQLRERSKDEIQKTFEGGKSIANLLNTLSTKYSMPIDEYISDVQPFETLRQRYALIYQSIMHEVDPKDFDTIITYLNRVKAEFSEPQHPKSKSKFIQKYQVDFLQNLIDKLESDNRINTNIIIHPKGIKCLSQFTPDKLKVIFSKLMDAGNLIDKSVTETNFVSTFQAGTLPKGWKKIKWDSSKKKLSTFVWKLTGKKPKPSDINRIFVVNSAFDSRDCVTAKQMESKQLHRDIRKLFPDPE